MRPVSFFPTHATILDCGASRTTLAVFRLRRGAKPHLEKIAIGPHPTESVLESGWLEKTAATLPALVAATGAGGPVTVILPPHLVLMKMVQTPPVAPAKRDKIIQFECQQGIPYPLAEVVWDRVVTGENALGCHVLLCAAKLDALDPLCAALAGVGLRATRLLPAVQVLAAGYRAASVASGERPVLLVNLGARSAVLVLLEGGAYQARSLAFGVSGDPARKLAVEITRTLAHFGRAVGTEPAPAVVLSGGGARTPGMEEALAGLLALPVCTWRAGEAVTFASGIAPEQHLSADTMLVEMLGAAALADGREPALNLLPPRLRQQAGRRKLRPWLAMAAGLSLIGVAAGLRWAEAGLVEKHRESTRLSAAVAVLRTEAARVEAIRAHRAELTCRQAALARIAHARQTWPKLLAALEDVFGSAESMWIERLEYAPEEVRGPGAGPPAPHRLAMTAGLTASGDEPADLRRAQGVLEKLRALPAVATVREVHFEVPSSVTTAHRRVQFVLVLQEGAL